MLGCGGYQYFKFYLILVICIICFEKKSDGTSAIIAVLKASNILYMLLNAKDRYVKGGYIRIVMEAYLIPTHSEFNRSDA